MAFGFVSPVEIFFGASGDYQVCLNWRLGNEYHTDRPVPSMAGSPLQDAAAAFFDVDDLAACTVNYGDGTGDLTGTAENSEHVCIGPAHTYASAGVYTVTFTATDTDGASGATSASHTAIPAESADLSLTKTDSKDPVKPGAQLVYTLAASNFGPDAAHSATVTCTSPSLASGSTAVFKITVTVKKTAKAGKPNAPRPTRRAAFAFS